MKKLFFISMFLAFSLTCFAQKGKWEKAQRKNTIESYQEFLKKYPNSEFSNDAILKLMGLEYKKAENVNSIGIYSSFIDTYGKYKNSYSEQAKNKLIQLEFDYAKKKNSVDAYEQFIQKYSDEKYYVDKARTSVAEIEFNEAKKTNSIEVYRKIIQKYHHSEFAPKAFDFMTKIEFYNAENINTIEGYKDFINKYPESKFTSDAVYKLVEIDFKDFKKSHSHKDFKIFIEKYSGNEKAKLLAYDAIEDIMVKYILTNGVGNRFRITSIIPDKEELSGSIAIEPVGNESKLSLLKTVYPKDRLERILHASVTKQALPYGNKSIWRFIGENKFEDNSFFKGYTFTGDTVEHLTFIVLDKVGFVYLHGKGTVKKDDKTIVSLKDLISNYKW